MERLRWVPSFSVGHRAMDAQHRQIVEMINRLRDHVDGQSEQSILDETLRELVEYALRHFRDEERLMAELQYAQCAEHKQLHRLFKEQVLTLSEKHRNQEPVDPMALVRFLTSWLVEHILHQDMQYAECLRNKRVARADEKAQ